MYNQFVNPMFNVDQSVLGIERTSDIRKMPIDGRMCDIVQLDSYVQNPSIYQRAYTAIEQNGMALPIISPMDYANGVTGINVGGLVSLYNMPSPEEANNYDTRNAINFADAENMKELISKTAHVKEIENEILTNSENVTQVKIGDNDSPAMKGFKEAFNAKQCDFNQYAPRYNGNFSNDRRDIYEETITLLKVVRHATNLDMKVTMSFSDKSPDVPNPMGKTVTVELTGGDDYDE